MACIRRPVLLDNFYEKPPVLVRGRSEEAIGGRIAYDGTELEPLDEGEVRQRGAPAARARRRPERRVLLCCLL